MYESSEFYAEEYKTACRFIIKSLKNTENNKEIYPYIELDLDGLNGFIQFLYNKNIIKKDKETYNICDLGFGLGTSMYYIYRQILETNFYDQNFNFTGIEINEDYIELFKRFLTSEWSSISNIDYLKNDIEIIHSDIMLCDLSKYDIIYSYTPFRNKESIDKYYKKIFSEMKEDSIFYEGYDNGKGINELAYNNAKDMNMNIEEIIFGRQKNIIIKK